MKLFQKKWAQTIITVDGIRCNHCESIIKIALGKIPSVKRIKISKRKQVMIEFDPADQNIHEQIVTTIQNAGYQVEISPDFPSL